MAKEIELIGMGEAATRLGLSDAAVARRLLQREGVALTLVSARAYVVKASDVAALAEKRKDYGGMGRPKKTPEGSRPSRAKVKPTEAAQ